MVQKCKVVLVNALYGLGQVLINLDCAMNIIIAILQVVQKGFLELTKWCTRQTKWCVPLQKGLARILPLIFRPYRHLGLEHYDQAFAMNLAHACVVLAANTHILRSGEHMRSRYSEDTDSYTVHLYSKPLCTFSARFTTDNGTFSNDNFQERLHWWGHNL